MTIHQIYPYWLSPNYNFSVDAKIVRNQSCYFLIVVCCKLSFDTLNNSHTASTWQHHCSYQQFTLANYLSTQKDSPYEAAGRAMFLYADIVLQHIK